MQQWLVPKSVKGLRGFLGLTGYYRKFIKDYGTIAAPLTAFLKKDAFAWNAQAGSAFVSLKQAVSSPPVLALPDFSKPFMVEFDASGSGIGAVLMQDHRPLAFHSQALKGKRLHLSTYEKEFLALVTTVKRWRPYLVGKPFIIKTDQQSLKYLLEQRVGTPAQQKWITKLLGYSFLVEYKKGQENKAADALSRRVSTPSPALSLLDGPSSSTLSLAACHEEAHFYLISFPCPTWLGILKESYHTDPEYQHLLTSMSTDSASPHFSLQNGLLLYKSKVFLSSNSPLKPLVLQHTHDSPLGAGYLKTLHRIKHDFFLVWHET